VGIVTYFGGTVAMNDVTQILSRIDSGDETAAERLLALTLAAIFIRWACCSMNC
jgi:hypothetical protein